MVLAFDTGVLDQVAGIGLEAGHGTTDMLINFNNLLDGRCFQQGRCDALLDTEDDTLRCSNLKSSVR
jgi:hypothetical protein